ncbi:MAG: Coenzyme F420 hydrogenase/dehydrogenase, beta subunit C-terminal domain [Planctomycetota bacterium]
MSASQVMNICQQDDCTACEACVSVCPVNAIGMVTNEKGFLFPVINDDQCIHCGLCQKACPANATECIPGNSIEKTVYAAWIKDAHVRSESSSGGLFSAIAQSVLDEGGVIFGARWTNEFAVVIDYCTDAEGLKKFRGSKYVQARTNDSYLKAKKFLEDGRKVLFSGTPCQITGLTSYLGREYSNLITIDLVCHGVPSPMVFRDYLQFMEKQFNERIVRVFFRYKKPAWSSCSVRIDFERTTYVNSTTRDPYFIGFNDCYFLRECCHRCKYANLNRLSDMTIADFWGYRATIWRMRDFHKGCSLLIPNTLKGTRVFQTISRSGLIFEERSIDEAIRGNLSLIKPYAKAERSDAFWKDYLVLRDFGAAVYCYFPPAKISFFRTLHRLKDRYMFLVPESVLSFIRRARRR